MRHKPRGLRGDAVLALDLASCDAVLVRAHLEYDHEPGVERDLRAVEDGAGEDGELLAAGLALPDAPMGYVPEPGLAGASGAPRRQEVVLGRALAMRANRAIGPSHCL